MRNKRMAGSVLCLCAAAAMLSGCGGESDSSMSETGSAAESTSGSGAGANGRSADIDGDGFIEEAVTEAGDIAGDAITGAESVLDDILPDETDADTVTTTENGE